MHAANISTSQQIQIMSQQYGGYDKMGCTKRDVWNFKRDYKEDTKDYDAQFLVDHFELQKSTDEGFSMPSRRMMKVV